MITEAMEQRAEELGIRLEYVNGLPIWEASPVIRHQRIFDPTTNRVSHYHGGQVAEHTSPVQLTFACGCRTTL